MEPSIPFHTLVKVVVAKDITNEKIRTLDLTLEFNIVTSKLESKNLSAKTFDPNLEVMFTQTTHPNNKSKAQFGKYCNYCHKSNHSVSNCSRKQREDEERK